MALTWGGALCGQIENFVMQRALREYTAAYGGIRDVDALSSLTVEGTQIQEGGSFNFVMRKKSPNSIRYRLDQGYVSVVTASDGRIGWMQIDNAGDVTTRRLNEDEFSVLKDEAIFETPLFRHMEKRYNSIALVGRERVGELSAYVFEVRDIDERITRYYLDTYHPHILRRDRLNEEGKITLQTVYRDYRDVGGYPFAFEIENRVDGKVVSLVKVDTITVNPGLLSFYFDMP
jgi:hypothetical protein